MVYSREGIGKLFSGVIPASARGAAITVGQMSIYDELKTRVLLLGFPDVVETHLAVSSVTVRFLNQFNKKLMLNIILHLKIYI